MSRRALWTAAALLVAGISAFSFDGRTAAIAATARAELGGDVLRELEAMQQFGQGASILVIASGIWLLDPRRRRRLLDWGLGILVVNAVVMPAKMLVGRPRPALGDSVTMTGPLGAYPLPSADPPGVYAGWDVLGPISSQLWSMPSNHTAHAALAAGFLWVLYPRLGPLVLGLAVIVGGARVVLGAHYVSDVLIGGAIGVAGGVVVTANFLGVRALDAIWLAFVDRRAKPAFSGSVRAEQFSEA